VPPCLTRRPPTTTIIPPGVLSVVTDSPDQLWERVQDMLVRRRENRLPPQRYAGGYALTELLRCACGSSMAGTNSRSYRYYRCTARCGRPHVRADELDAGVMDVIRGTLITPKAIREMIEILNEDIRMRSERRAPELERGRSRVRRLEQQDSNLRRALRSPGPNAAERITLEIEAVAVELREATTSLSITEVTERPLRVTPKVVRQTIDEMTGILEHAPLDTRVAWVRDLFERIDADSRESHAVAVWKAVTHEGVNRLDSVSVWLRR